MHSEHLTGAGGADEDRANPKLQRALTLVDELRVIVRDMRIRLDADPDQVDDPPDSAITARDLRRALTGAQRASAIPRRRPGLRHLLGEGPAE
jgi:hypothetical protein